VHFFNKKYLYLNMVIFKFDNLKLQTKMKRHFLMKTLFFLMFFLPINNIEAQTVSYSYDANGNRDTLSIITLKASNAGITESNQKAEPEIESYTNSLSDLKIKIYPNPVQDFVHLNINGLKSDEQLAYYLFNMQGQLIFTQLITNQTETFDFTIFPAGYYILKLRYKESVLEYKIVKQ